MSDYYLEAALGLARRGWAVLPVAPMVAGACVCPAGGGCKSPGKHPAVDGWREAATAQEAGVRALWAARPGSWVGVATGRPSGVWVLDVDLSPPGPEQPGGSRGISGPAALALMQEQHGVLPTTLRARTGSGGLHLWWRMPADGGDLVNRGRLRWDGQRTGLDVRGTGGYVVAPPSGHYSGGVYAWEGAAEIAEAPSWLIELVRPRVAVASGPWRGAGEIGGSGRARPHEVAWAAAALRRACEEVARAQPGARHGAVLRAAMTVGGLLWALDGAATRAALVDAALHAYGGDDGRRAEIERAIDGALVKGSESPLRVPDRPAPIDLAREEQARRYGGGDGSILAPVPDLSAVPGLPYAEPGQEEPPRPVVDGVTEEREADPALRWEEPAALPVIRTNGVHDRDLVRAAWGALSAAGVGVYRRDGELVRVVDGDDGAGRIESLGRAALLGLLGQVADWVLVRQPKAGEVSRGGQVSVPSPVPPRVAEMMLASPVAGLPVLTRIVGAPRYVRGADGRPMLLDRSGYHAAGQLWLQGPVPRRVPMSVSEAVATLRGDWLGDVAWKNGPPPGAGDEEGGQDEAAAFGWLLAGLTARLTDSSLPGLFIGASKQGTGKTTLAQALLIALNGAPVMPTPWDGSDEEVKKELIAAVNSGAPIFIDNLKRRFDHATFEAIMTGDGISYRTMHTHKHAVASTKGMSVVVTGNGGDFSRDAGRRMVVCMLDCGLENPDEREFSRNLKRWTLDNLGRIQSACFRLIEAGLAAGDGDAREGETHNATYSEVGRVVRPALRLMGLSGAWLRPVAEISPQEVGWRSLILQWAEDGGERRTAEQVLAVVREQTLEVGLGDGAGPQAMATALRKRAGQTWSTPNGPVKLAASTRGGWALTTRDGLPVGRGTVLDFGRGGGR